MANLNQRENVSFLEGQNIDAGEYWINKFSGELEKSVFPYDHVTRNTGQNADVVLQLEFPGELVSKLEKLSANSLPRLQMILIAGVVALLSRYSGNKDIVVGTSIYRQEIDAEFINTVLPLRLTIEEDTTFKHLLLQVKDDLTRADENQNYPMELLLQNLGVPFHKNEHFPLFDTAVLLENIQDKRYIRGVNPNMLFSFSRKETGMDALVEYNSCLYEKKTAARIAAHLERLLQEVLLDLNLKIDHIPLLTAEERKHLLFEVNETAGEYPDNKTIHQLFEEQVEKTPAGTAVVTDEQKRLTYRQLNKMSNQMAKRLMEKGVIPDTIVAIESDRSPELLIGILGILKAGGGYLPIVPGSPGNRIKFVLEDSNVSLLLTKKMFSRDIKECLPHFSPADIIFIDDEDIYSGEGDNPASGNKPGDLAYIIYTSGTTGSPKGVIVEQRGLVNYIWWAALKYIRGESINFPLYTSIAFDLTVTSIFTPLITGNSIVVYRDETDEFFIEKIIRDNKVGLIKTTPSHLKLIRNNNIKKSNIKRFILGGEDLETQLVKKIEDCLNNNIEIYNEYGPTETTVGCMIHKFDHDKDTGKSVPIGRPAANVQIYILDGSLGPVPVGVTGHLYLSGDGTARGYLNRVELTNEKFIESPFSKDKRIYKSGDMGRWNADENIEFCGRIDWQIKIKGHRIEPGEIENQLLKHPRVKEAVVVPGKNKDENKFLCAYVVSDQEIESPVLKSFLSARLPYYMLPSHFIHLDKIPLTPNGKVDRGALADAEIDTTEERYEAPRDHLENKLVEIWTDLLPTEGIGINDNFFMIGGDSIKSIQIAARMNKAGYKVEMKDIFENPTIKELASKIKKKQPGKEHTRQSTITGNIPLTPPQVWFFENNLTCRHYYNQAIMLYSEEWDEKTAAAIFMKLQEHHDMLRAGYHEENGEIIQTCNGLDYPLSLQSYDFRDREDAGPLLQEKANRLQASIDLENGPVMKLGLFRLDDGTRLLIVVHHLVIDGISWRILLEDIETLQRQYKRGEKLRLPLKTDSYKSWSEKLSEYADSEPVLREKAYWMELASKQVPAIKKDFDREDNYVKDMEKLSVTLKETETQCLLTKVNNPFGTTINDILLTALGLGIKETFGNTRIIITLEGHGREEIIKDIDVNRTLGWFSSLYPVLLDFSYGDGETVLPRQIKEIKETLRRVPNKGVGFGILKYLTAEAHKKEIDFCLNSQVSFNYLGQFDADLEGLSFGIASEPVGRTQSINKQREFELAIYGITVNRKLTVSVDYNKNQYKPDTIKRLLDNYKTKLGYIISFCAARREKELTPGDLTYKELSIKTLEQLGMNYSIKDIYPLSPMQEGMLFHTLYEEDRLTYFVQISHKFHRELYVPLVETSLDQLFKRYDILRTAFVYQGLERPLQIVLKQREADFFYKDIGKPVPGAGDSDPAGQVKTVISEFKKKDKQRPFKLEQDVLMRLAIFRLDNARYEFTWSFHHILMDGWCMGILITDFFEIYNSLLEKREARLPESIPYRKYIEWLEKRDKKNSKTYWKQYLAGHEETTGIPAVKKIANNNREYEKVVLTLEVEKTRELNKLAGRNQVTLNYLINAVWSIILGKYNRSRDVVFGAVVSGRPSEIQGVESMVGLFINTIPVRVCYERKTKFNRLLRDVQEKALASEPYHYYPLAEIQSESYLKQDLLDHIIIFENYPVVEQEAALSDFEVFEQTNYNFNIVIVPREQLSIKLEYNASVYDRDFIRGITRHLHRVFNQVLVDEKQCIEELTILSEAERREIIFDFNETKVEYAKDKTVHELFEREVEKTPQGTALIFDDRHLTYGALNKKVNRLARALREKAVKPGVIAAISTENSLETIIGLLGILKSGGAYLPIEPHYPEERIRYMLSDCNVNLLLSQRHLRHKRRFNCETVYLEEENIHSPGHLSLKDTGVGKDPAYIIFTSGSTGKPKGVLIEHGTIANTLQWRKNYYKFNTNDTVLQLASISFDASVLEIFTPLVSGSKLVLVQQQQRLNLEYLSKIIERNQVTHFIIIPNFYGTLLQEIPGSLKSLKKITVAGEAISEELVKEHYNKLNNARLCNEYGPTENSVCTTVYNFDNEKTKVLIGNPIHNVACYILDKKAELNPVGVPGELCVSGAGLARGYLNRQELTTEKFIEDPFAPGERIYRTGDLARWLPGGNIELLGRLDHQVKIRGSRIDLQEIESVLLRLEKVKEAAVCAGKDDNNNKYLTAYLAAAEEEFNTRELRTHLQGMLPAYMVPAYFVRLEKLPLTPNGKVDRKALNSYDIDVSPGDGYLAPKSEIEKTIAGIWQEVLKIDRVGVHDNFFDIGGHSLSIIKVNSKIKAELNNDITVADMFRYPTIRSLAEYISGEQTGELSAKTKEIIDESVNIMDEATNILFADEND